MAKGITRISVKGFKTLAEECSIEIRPLTILAGANSSGKSSIMQPLLMMKQTLDATHDPGALLIYGPNIRFTLVDQFLSQTNQDLLSEFQVGLEVDKINYMRVRFKKSPRGSGVDIAEVIYCFKNERLITLRPTMTRDEIISTMPKDEIFESLISRNLMDLKFKVEQKRFFLKAIGYSGYENGPRSTFDPGPQIEVYSDCIQKIIHVPAIRGNPERNYRILGIGPLFPGTFENYIASVINHWQTTNDNRLKALGDALELLGLTWKIDVKQIDDTSIEILVARLPHKTRIDVKDLVSIADVGFGVSQTLPVLIALLVADPGQLVYIEQPEIHIHPRAQTAMAHILADAANRGVRVVVETHSSLLLLGIQSLVAEGKLSPDEVKLHWFKRRPEDGVTEVTSADLDDAGAFGDWPEDFADVELKEQSRYMDAAELRLRNR